jgi:hypothetical protein
LKNAANAGDKCRKRNAGGMGFAKTVNNDRLAHVLNFFVLCAAATAEL